MSDLFAEAGTDLLFYSLERSDLTEFQQKVEFCSGDIAHFKATHWLGFVGSQELSASVHTNTAMIG